MNYDQAKRQVLAALWLPEVGDMFRYDLGGEKITIRVCDVRGAVWVYKRYAPTRLFRFLNWQWWQVVADGSLTVYDV
jgi:hypothetical protein